MNIEVHILGVWLVLMIIHGLLVDQLGEAYKHLPLFVGLFATFIIIIRRKWTAIPIEISIVFFLLVVIMFLSGITGIDTTSSMAIIAGYIKGLLLAILIAGVIKNPNQIRIITLYCMVGILFGVYEAFRQHLTGEYDVEGLYSQRVAGLRGDPNDTAMLLLAGVPLSIYWLTHTEVFYKKIFFLLCLGSIVAAIALTGSRGGSVSLLITLSIIYFRKPTFKGAVIGGLVLVLAVILAPPSYMYRMETLITGEKRGTSLKGRGEFVRKGLKVYSEYPILGVGLGNYGKAINDMQAKSIIRIKGQEHVAHNMYLQFFIENGLFGGVLFLFILGYSLLSLIKFDKFYVKEVSVYGLGFCMALSLFGMLFSGLFLSQAKNSVLWFFIGVSIATRVIKNKYDAPRTNEKVVK